MLTHQDITYYISLKTDTMLTVKPGVKHFGMREKYHVHHVPQPQGTEEQSWNRDRSYFRV